MGNLPIIKNRSVLLCLCFILCLQFSSGCGPTKPQVVPPEVNHFDLYPKDADGLIQVNTFFATDRSLEDTSTTPLLFGPERGKLTYGTCRISLPPDHRIGVLESPSGMRFWEGMNPQKHVMVQETFVSDHDSLFFADIARYVKTSAQRRLFMFIHGYNVSFEDAARRAGQFAYDLDFTGAAVFYSWPSQASISAYTVDETNIQWTQSNFKRFLQDLMIYSQADQIFLMAHSMGNRALTQVLASLATSKEKQALSTIKEIVFIAPDVDAQVMKNNLIPEINQSGVPITLYVSSEDRALLASKKVHGYERAGESVMIMPNVETIDATQASEDFMGHSYFAQSRAIIGDLYYLFRDRLRADHRFGLKPIQNENGKYWILQN
ncbi:alpha/beta hydrolase [candidate division KSB1 bacterium]|nr:alpha/beta hydrolase [candidate division KSB1 bacterium]